MLRRLPTSVDCVADLGCGHDFQLLRRLCQAGHISRGIAVDLSLDVLRGSEGCISRLEADLNQRLEIADESVDVVLSLAVIEHLTDPEVHLREAYRILRPAGSMLLTTPAPRSRRLLEFLAFRLRVIDAGEIADHKRYFSETDLRTSLVEAGFDAATVEYRPFLLGLNQLVSAAKAAR